VCPLHWGRGGRGGELLLEGGLRLEVLLLLHGVEVVRGLEGLLEGLLSLLLLGLLAGVLSVPCDQR